MIDQFKLILCILLLTALSLNPAFSLYAQQVSEPVIHSEKQRIQVIANASEAAISVFGNDGQGGGSGVIVTADGYALTNFHVVMSMGAHMKCSLPDGNLYDAVIVSIDPTGDVAMIKLFGREDFPTAVLADSDEVRTGDWCFAVGNPFLLATDFQPTVSWGIVSGVHRYQYPAGTILEYADCIQTDAAINPGNSGGPLFNAQGRLIGINGRGSFEKRGRVNVGVGYAISINQIKNFMGYLRSGRIVDHATLGATVENTEDGRVIVSDLLESSDAYRRGLRYGDEIVSFADRSIRSSNAFKNVLGIYPRGWRVPLVFRRDQRLHQVLVRLAGVHSQEELINKVQSGSADPHQPPPRPGRSPKDKLPEKDKPSEEGNQNEQSNASNANIPKHLESYFHHRAGYANYYFNELNRDRVWNSFLQHGDYTQNSNQWRLTGELDSGSGFEILLSNENAKLTIHEKTALLDTSLDLDTQLKPPGSGGLTVALHLWRRLLTLGPKKYGEVFYRGTTTMIGQDDLVDVLTATHDVIQSNFMFDKNNGRLLGMEMFSADHRDPCEIYFKEYQEVEGLHVPVMLEVRFGNGIYANVKIHDFLMQ